MRQAVRQASLLEREGELAVVDEALDRARQGLGGVVVVEAAAGLGKTVLLGAAQERAAADGLQVITARGFELEREFTFGVLRQLYEPLVRDLDASERDRLLSGAAGLAAPALGLMPAPATQSADPIFSVAHGVYWLTATLAARTPLLIAVDDVHWSDPASLRCVLYLAARLGELPALLIVANRPGEPNAPAELLTLGTGEGNTRLSPLALTSAATGSMLAERMGEEPDPAFAAAAHELTGGNPFLVAALAADLREEDMRPDAEGARQLPAVTPEAVSRSVLVRLGRMGDDARALAEAVAVLGDGTTLARAAALVGLDEPAAVAAADRLALADVLRHGPPLAFSHPLIREAVHSEMPVHARAALHATAARLVHRGGGSPQRVGAQLLRTVPAGEAWVAERLTEAGEAAEARGDLDSALAFLGRALEEPPPADARPAVLHVLGRSQVRSGVPEGYVHLDEAVELTDDLSLKAAIGFDRARALVLAGRPDAVEALERATAGLPRDERGEAVRKQTELIALGRMSPATAPLVHRLAETLRPVAERREPGWEAVLGILAGQAYLAGGPATRVGDLARESLEARRARGDDPSESAGYLNACYLLMQAGEYAEAERHLEHAIESARVAHAPIGFVTAATFRARSAVRRGELAQAEADARMALDAAGVIFTQPTLPSAIGILVEVMLERAELDDADRLLAGDFTGDLMKLAPFAELLYARGRLRHAQGRHTDALADLMEAGESAVTLAHHAPGPYPWRPWTALVLSRLGRRDEAEATAAEGVAIARGYGAPRDLGIALRAAGLVAGGDEGLALLEESVAVLADSPVRLELARSRTDLGAALRRAGHRQAARDTLREALDGASRSGATALAERARTELVTAGAKPRRERTSGVDALTASERRVAELALDGLTNRQIAEALFVTASTVEKHLASAYAKLGIGGRDGLAGALTPSVG